MQRYPRGVRFFLLLLLAALASANDRPNVLWITCEDMGPDLGSYGHPNADTPRLDALAKEGLRYTRCSSNAPVCAPARTTILTGRYPFRYGALPMRTSVPLPEGWLTLPERMRDGGYYCTNRSKTDYNVELGRQVWDESSGKAHWRNRPEGQPFFAVVNLTMTHESQSRKRPHEPRLDPAEVVLPAHHPDHPDVRQDWAQYHDKVHQMDRTAGKWLDQLEEDGLAEDTIVFFYSDHGAGMPGHKRTPKLSGLHVPLIVRVPERFRGLAPADAGTVVEEPVAFIDLMPTMLRLAELEEEPGTDGRAFLGKERDDEPEYLLGYRARMDERIDLVRSLWGREWIYVRHFMPHKPEGQYVAYMFETPMTRAWKGMHDAGELNEVQRAFWEPKPVEELYNLKSDPGCTQNLAALPEYQEVTARMGGALKLTMVELEDKGLIEENDLLARAGGGSPLSIEADWKLLAEVAWAAGDKGASLLKEWQDHEDASVRYWFATGLTIRGRQAVRAHREWLTARLQDEPWVGIAAAEALGLHGNAKERELSLDLLVRYANLDHSDVRLAGAALSAIDALGALAWPARDKLAALPKSADHVHSRLRKNIEKLLGHIEPSLEYEEVVYLDREGEEFLLHVWRPEGPVPAGGRPACVFFHGGGFKSGSPSQFYNQATVLAGRGMVTASASYRLGQDGHKPEHAMADAQAAVRYLRQNAERFGIDPERLAASGGSAGGHLAAATATLKVFEAADVSCRPNALVLYNPVIDLGPEGYAHDRAGPDWREKSPLHNIGEEGPPCLFLLGDKDNLVPVATGEAFRDRWNEGGGTCDLRVYEDAGHGWFNRGSGYLETTDALTEFFEVLGWL